MRASHTVTVLGDCPESPGMGVYRKGAASRCGGSVGRLRAAHGLRVAFVSGFRRVAPEPSSSTDRRGCRRGNIATAT